MGNKDPLFAEVQHPMSATLALGISGARREAMHGMAGLACSLLPQCTDLPVFLLPEAAELLCAQVPVVIAVLPYPSVLQN